MGQIKNIKLHIVTDIKVLKHKEMLAHTTILLLLVLSGTHASEEHEVFKHISIVNNNPHSTWKAGYNFMEDVPVDFIKRLCGALPHPNPEIIPMQMLDNRWVQLPEQFDSRQKWGTVCPSVKEAHLCGGSSHMLLRVWFWMQWWIPRVCMAILRRHRHRQRWFMELAQNPCHGELPTPECVKKCEPGYNVSYADDKHRSISTYKIIQDEREIQKEIMTNGPVEGAFTVYADFPNYKSGVYQHMSGAALGRCQLVEHSVGRQWILQDSSRCESLWDRSWTCCWYSTKKVVVKL